ncbi:MAG: hypothetical protein KDD09_19745 [Phaeodactylibacter sp.]|nr:hypothetical protein [Phaeodactylibacter sp.]
MMKKATLCTLMVVAGFFLYLAPAHAQRNLALYSMPGLQQASHVNPGFIPDASLVIGLPLISNINAGFSNNGFTLKDIGGSGWGLNGLRLNYETILPIVENDNIAGGGLNTNLLTIGYRLKNDYIAFESSENVVGTFYYPKDAIQFGSDIHNGNFNPGQVYNLNGLAYDLTHFRDFSFVYARDFGRASAGVRIRYLVGLENYSSAGPGLVLTSTEETGVYQIQGQLELWAAGVQSFSGEGSYPIWGQANNTGFAFDFGTTYSLGEKLKASFSVVNLGGIHWVSGVNRSVLANEIESPRTKIDEIFDGFIDKEGAANLSYSTALPTLFNLGSAYQMNEQSTFNLLLNSRYIHGKHSLGAALSYSRKFSPGFRGSLTYSAVKGSLLNLGGGIVAKAGPLQLFLVTDNLLSAFNPSGSHNTNVSVGANLVFHKKPKVEIALVDTAMVAPIDTMALASSETPRPSQPAPPTTAPNTARPSQPAPIEKAKPPKVASPPPTTPPPAQRNTPVRYAIFQGAIRMEGSSEKVNHYYFDVYKLYPDGQRELMRTGRTPGGDYKLYLDRGYDHEVSFRHSDSKPMVIEFSKEELENAGQNITRNITLRKVSSAPDTGNLGVIEEKGPAPEVEDLMDLTVPELQQEEAQVLQRPAPKEENSKLWVDQQPRSLQLNHSVSVYKDMDVNSRVLARLSEGMEIEVLERTTAEWWMVAYRSKIGWIETSQLK